ncbi:hypothetical protein TKK_0017481 [Trichogramma kaykai]|uniref:CDP-diacylglycerol--glycerol-3-phosphate 3-phosphatidyltransferase n=1 Tax=Trichogramma kaykai TaxID=54128 RepID=A0ABD2W1V9_9HYME
MSALSICSKSFSRFSRTKVRRQRLTKSVVRYKMHAAMIDEENENFEEFTSTKVQFSGFSWLHQVAPAFPVDGSKVTVIYEPKDFYTTLLEKCKTAKKRITLASLYLGTGKLEQELVKSIRETVESQSKNVEVNILLDYQRGSRGEINSIHMLMPMLINDRRKNCKVFFYHTPKLRGYLKEFIPTRFNELIGLQHMKVYLIDDTLIISGANLSNDYFNNRQDRYFMIENSPDLCDFYYKLVKKVTEFSFQLDSYGGLHYHSDSHPTETSEDLFAAEAYQKIHGLLQSEIEQRSELNASAKSDTWIFPLVQMAQINLKHDSKITLKLLENAPAGATLRLATGYFNLTSEYKNAILKDCQADCHLLTAHPEANGFYGAKGVAGGIPAAYTKIEKSFFNQCKELKQNNRVKLWEFVKTGWTYHAKGLWYSLPGHDKPSLTLIGSPNFGYRSVEKDLETQIAIVTKNEALQDSLQKEHKRLFEKATPVTEKTFTQKERLPPAWVRMAVYFFRYYF